MFRKRAIKVTLEKQGKSMPEDQPVDNKSIEETAEVIQNVLEKLAVKVMIGVCAYVVLDTYRQVSIAKALRDSEKI